MKKYIFSTCCAVALALSGAVVITPTIGVLTGQNQTVYANTQTAKSLKVIYYDIQDMSVIKEEVITINEGETRTIDAPTIDGYVLSEASDGISGSASLTISYDMVKDAVDPVAAFYYKKATNTTPPAQQPIEILVTHLVPPGSRGSDALILEQETVELNPGGQLFLEPKEFTGYTAVTADPVTLNYDEAAAGKTSVTFSYKVADSGGGNGGGTQTPPTDNPGGNGSGTQTPPTDTPPVNNHGGGNGDGTQTVTPSKPVAPTTKTEAKTPANTAGGVDIFGWLAATPLAALFSFKKKEE